MVSGKANDGSSSLTRSTEHINKLFVAFESKITDKMTHNNKLIMEANNLNSEKLLKGFNDKIDNIL